MKFAASMLLVGIVGLAACDDGKPIVLHSSSLTAPNGKWVAVVEEVDNGLGFGLGALYWEVHLIGVGGEVYDHGEKSKSSIFYIQSTYAQKPDISVTWSERSALHILFNPASKPGYSLSVYRQVPIEIRPAAVAESDGKA